jgi:SAM-dependent methyltransferase
VYLKRLARRDEMKESAVILDACCGSKMFWFDKDNQDVLFIDIRKEEHTLSDGRKVKIAPDMIMDFTSLDFPDGRFKLVVFDPPHMETLSNTSFLAKKYGVLPPNWRQVIKNGFNECWRVLDTNGILIFKWSEPDIKVSDVLKLIDQKPLFGHRTMINNRTIWMCFMKTNPHSRETKLKVK